MTVTMTVVIITPLTVRPDPHHDTSVPQHRSRLARKQVELPIAALCKGHDRQVQRGTAFYLQLLNMTVTAPQNIQVPLDW